MVNNLRKAGTVKSNSDQILALAEAVAHVGHWSWNFDTQEVFWSPECFNIFGRDPNTWFPTGENFRGDMPDEDREKLEEANLRGFESGRPFQLEYRYFRGGSRHDVRWISVSCDFLVDANGTKLMVGIAQDITESKLLLDQLREKTRQLSKAQEISKVGHWHLDATTNEVSGSDELFHIFGISRDEATLDAFIEVVHPEDREYDVAHIQRGLETGQSWDIEHRLLRRDGSISNIRATGEAKLNGEGNVESLLGTVQDITDQVETLKALQESEERFASLFENAAVGIAELGPDGRYRRANAKFSEIAGYSHDELLMLTHTDITHPDDREADTVLVQEVLDGKARTFTEEKRYLRKDGKSVWIQLNAALVRDDGGEPKYIVSVTQDISDRKEAEHSLRQLNQELERRIEERTRELAEKSLLLEAAFESISEGFALFDADDCLVFCNDAYRELAQPIADLLKPGVAYETLLRAFWESGHLTSLEGGQISYSQDDLETNIEARLARHRDPGGEFEVHFDDGRWTLLSERRTSDGGIAMVHTDITAVKRAEQEARSILDASPFAVGVSRAASGEILYLNARLFGMSAEDARGRVSMDFWADPQDRQRFLEIFRRDHRVPATEVRMRRSDGNLFWAMVAWEGLPLFGEDAVLFWVNDISDLVAAREAILGAKNEAETANRAKSEFLSSMSHELRTPLNAVLGFAQLLRDYPDQPLTAEQAAHVEQILDGGQHLLGLVNEVLDLARIESGRLDLSVESVDLAQTVRESLVLVQPLADERDIAIIVDADIASGTAVMADPSRLKQVLLNVLSNAVKYNRDKGTVSLSAAATDSDMLRISISDTGPGIAAESHDEVFRPFSRLGAEASKVEGTGIGLTISRQLIESMGGTLDFESTLGQGSTFWIEVPIADQRTASAADA